MIFDKNNDWYDCVSDKYDSYHKNLKHERRVFIEKYIWRLIFFFTTLGIILQFKLQFII